MSCSSPRSDHEEALPCHLHEDRIRSVGQVVYGANNSPGDVLGTVIEQHADWLGDFLNCLSDYEHTVHLRAEYLDTRGEAHFYLEMADPEAFLTALEVNVQPTGEYDGRSYTMTATKVDDHYVRLEISVPVSGVDSPNAAGILQVHRPRDIATVRFDIYSPAHFEVAPLVVQKAGTTKAARPGGGKPSTGGSLFFAD